MATKLVDSSAPSKTFTGILNTNITYCKKINIHVNDNHKTPPIT